MACQYYGPTHGTSKWQNCNGLNIKPTDDIKRAHADMQKHGR